MKKISLVSIASFIFLFLCSVTALLLKNFITDQWVAFGIGLAILAVSGIIAFLVRERVAINILCFFISSVAMGFLIRSWYINRVFNNSLWLMCLISLAAVLYLWIFFALSKIPFIHKSKAAYIVLCVLYAIISVGAYLAVMLNTKTTYISTFGFYMIIEFAFIFAMSLEVNNNRELIRNIALSSYSVFIVAIVIALLFAVMAGGGDCDCDCGADDCCDLSGCDCGSSNTKSRKKKK